MLFLYKTRRKLLFIKIILYNIKELVMFAGLQMFFAEIVLSRIV